MYIYIEDLTDRDYIYMCNIACACKLAYIIIIIIPCSQLTSIDIESARSTSIHIYIYEVLLP
jgi:hypothetical protein